MNKVSNRTFWNMVNGLPQGSYYVNGAGGVVNSDNGKVVFGGGSGKVGGGGAWAHLGKDSYGNNRFFYRLGLSQVDNTPITATRGKDQYEMEDDALDLEAVLNNQNDELADFGRNFRTAAKYGTYIPQGAMLFVTKTKMGKALSYGRGVTLSEARASQALGKSFSRSLTRLGWGLATINAYSIQDDYKQGRIGLFQRNCEEVSNGLTQVPMLGWAWGVGWEGGRYITESDFYIDNLRPYIWSGLDYIFKR